MHVGIPYAPISVPYSLVSQDFKKLKGIIDTLTPGLVFAADGKAFARAIAATVPADVEVVATANPAGDRPTTPFAEFADTQPTRGGRSSPRQGRPGHDRKIPVHFGLDRPAERRDQHAAHALRQSGDDPFQLRLHCR